MNANLPSLLTRLIVTITFVLMVTMNGLATALPLNGRMTGEISDLYGNLFAPAGITFAIWGVIYLLLGAHVLYQWGLFSRGGRLDGAVLNRIGTLFSLSSIANTFWILAWHYDVIWLSVLLIIFILGLLIALNQTLVALALTRREALLVRLPFSVYFGWITVATVANITTWLVSIKWSGFDVSEPVWAVVILAVAATIGTVTMLRNRDVAYGLVLIWAFIGILIKHTSATGFAGSYPAVIGTTIACVAAFAASEAVIVWRKRARGT